jgi:hypothetical protein
MGLADSLKAPSEKVVGVVRPLLEAAGLVSKKKSSKSSRGKSEGAALYRQLGVAEDAGFEEIQDAFERLSKKFSGDKKQVIRLEKVKDQIMDLRLKQRMEGTLKVAGAALRADEAEVSLTVKPRKALIPRRVAEWITVPDKAHVWKCTSWMGGFGMFSLLFPAFHTSTQLVMGLIAMWIMNTRGHEKPVTDEAGRLGAVETPSSASFFLTFFLAIFGFNLGAYLGGKMFQIMGPGLMALETYRMVSSAGVLWFLSLFFDTWRPSKKNRG